MLNKKNAFVVSDEKRSGKKQPTGKRVGKSKPSKANNQLNRRIK